MPGTATKAPMGVVIPGYGHPQFLAEAIICACEQSLDRDYKVVVVDDGCKFPETAEVVQELMQQYEGRLHYLRQKNTKLPGARNSGVRFLFNLMPDLDSVYFLDADNRIAPYSLQAFRDALGEDEAIGWAYPDISMFGLSMGSEGFDTRETAPDYSVLKHLIGNISEAGSLVRADVFRRGVEFNEQMTSGYEDWDFWLSALEAGYKGTRARSSGFLYRRRPESMLADSKRLSDMLIAQIRQSHKSLYSPKFILEREQHEAPAIAVHIHGTDEILVGSDLKLDLRRLSIKEFRSDLHDWCHSSREFFFPELLISILAEQWAALRENNAYLRWCLWRLHEQPYPLVSVAMKVEDRFTSGVTRQGQDHCTMPSMFLALKTSELRPMVQKPLARGEAEISMLPEPAQMVCRVPFGIEGHPSGSLAEQQKDLVDLAFQFTPMPAKTRHQTRKYAGPSCSVIRSDLISEICAVEDRHPFPVHTAARRAMIFLPTSHLNAPTAVSRLKALLSSLANENVERLLVLEIGPKQSFTGMDFSWLPLVDDVVPVPLVPLNAEYKLYQGRRISQQLGLSEAEDVTVLARSCDYLISCGAAAGLEALGQAKSHGAEGYVWLDDSFMVDDGHEMGLQAKLLAFEHAVKNVVTDNQDYVHGLSAEGFPPSKFISSDAFWALRPSQEEAVN